MITNKNLLSKAESRFLCFRTKFKKIPSKIDTIQLSILVDKELSQ